MVTYCQGLIQASKKIHGCLNWDIIIIIALSIKKKILALAL